jgi:hypothetical protein
MSFKKDEEAGAVVPAFYQDKVGRVAVGLTAQAC